MVDNAKTQPVPKIYPFNRETVRMIVGDPEAVVSRTTLSVCEICSSIPDSVDLSGEDQRRSAAVPDAASRLADHVEIKGGLKLLECPSCGCLYKLERRSEFLAGPGEGEWSLARLQKGDAFELVLGQRAKAILRRENRWVLEW
jgi:hypothetical protein